MKTFKFDAPTDSPKPDFFVNITDDIWGKVVRESRALYDLVDVYSDQYHQWVYGLPYTVQGTIRDFPKWYAPVQIRLGYHEKVFVLSACYQVTDVREIHLHSRELKTA